MYFPCNVGRDIPCGSYLFEISSTALFLVRQHLVSPLLPFTMANSEVFIDSLFGSLFVLRLASLFPFILSWLLNTQFSLSLLCI